MKYIIAAEDDKYYGSIFKTKFTKEGYEITVVENGNQLLDAMRQRKPDLVLLDLIMPVKDGFEALSEIRADENLKTVPVIVLSNLGQEEDIKRAKDLGANEYFIKADLSLEEMVGKAKSFLPQE